MPRAKAPPRVKGPYSERGGSRFRIRVCDVTGHRDLYFATLLEAQSAVKQAARGLRQSSHSRQLGFVLDAYMQEKIQHGSCSARSAQCQRAHLRAWLVDYLEEDIGKLTPKRAALRYEQLVATPLSNRRIKRHNRDLLLPGKLTGSAERSPARLGEAALTIAKAVVTNLRRLAGHMAPLGNTRRTRRMSLLNL